MHSFLITGGNLNQRQTHIASLLAAWNVSPFDLVTVEEAGPSIGINQVRELQHRLLLMPINSPVTALVINHADLLTTEAQNALLKTLEEPPPHAKVILESQTSDVFLPTVLSRCQLIGLGNMATYDQKEILQCIDTLKYLSQASVGKRLKKIDELAKNKDGAAAWLDLALAATRRQLFTTNNSQHTTKLLRSLLHARTHLSANVNYKLVLDYIFLTNI